MRPRRDARVPPSLPGRVDSGAKLRPVPFERLSLRPLPLAGWLAGLGMAWVRGSRAEEIGREFRVLTEGLGGLWVSFAQLLSRQTVRFPVEFCEQLKLARYPVVSFPFAQARRIIEAQLGAPLERHFEAFDETPFASLPFAQIYRARLRGANGGDVSVRVLEAGTRERIARDARRIRTLVPALEAVGILPARYRAEMLDELDATGIELTDYRYEVAHLRRLRRVLRGHKIRVLRVLEDLSGPDVLTCEYIAGPSVDDLREARVRDEYAVSAWCRANGIDLRKVGRRLLKSYLRQVCEETDFDRNFLPRHVLLQRNGRIALVGVRSARTLQRSFRTTYAMLLRSIALSQYEKAADCLFLLCDSLPQIDLSGVKVELVAVLRAYRARAALRPAAAAEKSLFTLFRALVRVLEQHRIYPSWQFFDVQLGWSRMDECLLVLMPQDNMIRRLGRYFDDAQGRQANEVRKGGARRFAANLMGRASEFGMFQGIELRRRARVFVAIVGKGPFFFATIAGVLQLALTLAGLAGLLVFVHEQTSGGLPSGLGGWVAPLVRRVGGFRPSTWLPATLAILLLARVCARFRRKLLEPEPVGSRSR